MTLDEIILVTIICAIFSFPILFAVGWLCSGIYRKIVGRRKKDKRRHLRLIKK